MAVPQIPFDLTTMKSLSRNFPAVSFDASSHPKGLRAGIRFASGISFEHEFQLAFNDILIDGYWLANG